MTQSPSAMPRKSRPFSRFEWMIALRYLVPNRKQAFTSIISIISFLGILIGVWALIVVMSVMNGFRTELMDRILGVNGHLIVNASFDSNLDDYESLIPVLDQLSTVRFVLPVVGGQALLQGENQQSFGTIVRGMRESDLAKLDMIENGLQQGEITGFDDSDGVIIGSGVAENLGLTVGSWLDIISPEGDETPFGITPRMKSYQVKAIFSIGMSEYDSTAVFLPFEEAQTFFNLGESIRSLEVFAKDPDQIDMVRAEVEVAVGRSVYMVDWRQRYQSFFSALQVERNVMFVILSLIILVASLNIISSLIMLVKDKSHDIAILRTMGAKRSAVMRIFIMTGAVIGISGTIFGVILGIITCLNIDHIQHFISNLTGTQVFNPEVYYLTQLPARIDMAQTLTVGGMAMLLSLLATILPAWRAAKLDPVQALRYE